MLSPRIRSSRHGASGRSRRVHRAERGSAMSDAPSGRVLEISVQAPGIRESRSFYETLGFEQLPVGEVWPYPYAVVTDGPLYFRPHAPPIREAKLTFVLPDLRARLGTLES